MPPKRKAQKKKDESDEDAHSSPEYTPIKKSIKRKQLESSDEESDVMPKKKSNTKVKEQPKEKTQRAPKAKAKPKPKQIEEVIVQYSQLESEGESEAIEKNVENFKLHQKKETPPHDDPSRIFYETLYKENPQSVLAIKYCLDYGLIDDQDIKKAQRLLENSKNKQR